MYVHDPYSPAAASVPVPEPEPTTIAGTTREILSWIDGDVDRAVASRDAELASEKPRQGLLNEIAKLLK